MKLCELNLSRNRHLTIFEKNKVNKMFDDKRKRMPDALFNKLSNIEVLEVEESVGTVIVLNTGKTLKQLEGSRRKTRQAAKDAMKKISMASMLLTSSVLGCDYCKEDE